MLQAWESWLTGAYSELGKAALNAAALGFYGLTGERRYQKYVHTQSNALSLRRAMDSQSEARAVRYCKH